jgi:lipopolysaccharide transport system permease protein
MAASLGSEDDAVAPRPEPQEAAVVIEARHGWRELGITELWAHRELFYFLVWRTLKVKYKQTFFGVSWAVLQPALLMAIFSISLGGIPGVGPSGVPYPLFVFCGLLPWTLFAQSLTLASNSLVGGEEIITKVYFPRLLLPFAAVAACLIDFLIAFVMMIVLLAWFGVVPSLSVLWVPALTALVLVTALGVGTFLAGLNVRYRDVKHVVPFLLQAWLFASPVIYQSSLIPEPLRALFALNPMAGVVQGFRWALIGEPRPDGLIITSAVVSVVILLAALLYFRRVERTFADVI